MQFMKLLKDKIQSVNYRKVTNFFHKIKRINKALLILSMLLLFSCSLPPDVPVTKEALDNTKLYSRFVIEESPDVLLYALNKNGEIVVRATYRNVPIYIKVFATSKGILWYVYPRER